MIAVNGYAHFGGIHGESAALKNLLAFAGVSLSEALCFGIAGGIGAGYSFCPSVVRHGTGSGVSIVGRHKVYVTGAGWYQDFFDRVGISTRITETTAVKKAYQNLTAELEAGRPTVVWCSRAHLPFLGSVEPIALWMHSFIVYAADEDRGIAYGSDIAPTRVSLTLDELAAARNGVCSHKNRTLTIDPPKAISADVLRSGLRAGLQAGAKEMLDGKMQTFSLPGLEIWAKMVTNGKSKDGWGKVFAGGLIASALKDVYNSIVTGGTGGDLFRSLFADSLDEAAALLGNPGFAELAQTYRRLGKQWAELAETALPSRVKPLKAMKDLLDRRAKLIEEKGEKGQQQVRETSEKLHTLELETRKTSPLTPAETSAILEAMRVQIEELHRQETDAAQRLAELAK
jgi:hypothetical protein